MGFPGGTRGIEPTANARDMGRYLGWEDPLEEGMAPTPLLLPRESHE